MEILLGPLVLRVEVSRDTCREPGGYVVFIRSTKWPKGVHQCSMAITIRVVNSELMLSKDEHLNVVEFRHFHSSDLLCLLSVAVFRLYACETSPLDPWTFGPLGLGQWPCQGIHNQIVASPAAQLSHYLPGHRHSLCDLGASCRMKE